jgi:hypothetical protein
MYRRLIAARLRYESRFSIVQVGGPLTTDRIAWLSETIDTKFVVFIRTSHQLAPNYMTTVLEYLRVRTAYLAEPVMYTGGIPNNVAATKIDDAYRYARDTDIFGVAPTPIGSGMR